MGRGPHLQIPASRLRDPGEDLHGHAQLTFEEGAKAIQNSLSTEAAGATVHL